MASRRDRLHQLLDLARAYRGWSRAQLARALNRDTTRLYSDTEDPKFSFVVALADVLEWPMDALTEFLWTGNERLARPPTEIPEEYHGKDFATLYPVAQEAYKRGEYAEAIELSKTLLTVAKTADDRARAYNVEFLGWDGLGRFTKGANAIRHALMQTPIDTHVRFALEGNLANTQYTLWDLPTATGICTGIIDWYTRQPPTNTKQTVSLAYARYVRGNARRRSSLLEPQRAREHCEDARVDLAMALDSLIRLANDTDAEHLRGLAHTCEAGILEVEVTLGDRDARETIEYMLEHLTEVTDPETVPAGSWLESFGWWCIFGGNIGLRFLKGRDLQRPVAIFINKALEIGERTGNWAFRERVLSMEHMLRQSLSDSTGYLLEPIIDQEDIRLITGTMGRFPTFQRLGWEILTTAKVVHHGRRT